MRLYDTNGALVATAISRDVDLDNSGGIDPMTESGVYLFQNVAAQNYFVGETPPLAFPRTTQNEMDLIEVSKTAQGLVAGDLDGDSDNDLVVNRTGAAFGSQRGLTVLINEGAGVFTPVVPVFGSSVDNSQTDPVLADFNLDGRVDIGVGVTSRYYILPQSESGSFLSGINRPVGDFVNTVKADDVNDDDAPDLIGMLVGDDQVFVALNMGLDGTDTWLEMADPTLYAATGIESIDVGDINGDTFPDIVTGLGTIFINDGFGNFTRSNDAGLESISASANDLLLFDMDGDPAFRRRDHRSGKRRRSRFGVPGQCRR